MFGQLKFGEGFFGQGATAPTGADASVNATGFGLTSASGTVTVTATASTTASGKQAATASGSVTVTAGASSSASGYSTASASGSVTVTAAASISGSGSQVTSAAGTVTATGDDTDYLSGYELTAQSGTVTVSIVDPVPEVLPPVPNRIAYTNEAALGYAPANYYPPKEKRHISVEAKLSHTGVLEVQAGSVTVYAVRAVRAHDQLASLFVHRARPQGKRVSAISGQVAVKAIRNPSDEELLQLLAMLAQ